MNTHHLEETVHTLNYCKTLIVHVPCISRPWRLHENDGSWIYISAAIC